MIYKDTKTQRHKTQDAKLELILMLIFCVLAAGCSARTKEWTRNFLGISTKELEVARPKALKSNFTVDYDACYKKVKEILKDMGSYIYAEDKSEQLVAFYVSGTDTTPVGIFFTALDGKNTQLEISSPSSYTRDNIAPKIFKALDKAFTAQKESEKSDDTK